MAHILVVDDERELCDSLGTLLCEQGHSAECVYSGEAALAAARAYRPDLVLLDLKLEGIDGLETLCRLQARAPALPIVILTAFGDVEAAVRAMKLGATDFISKPFDNDALLATIENLLALRREVRGGARALVGDSPSFRNAMALVKKFAVPDINILLLGETGTGKELFARTIHSASKRRQGPFVALDCSTLAESLIESELYGHERGAFTGATGTRAGKLELARGGTLFLDEISNLGVQYQAKLLRVLQERSMERVGGRETIHLDIRVISATNINLKEAIVAGRFRQDLYYRLCEMTIVLPPLREREGDIRNIAEHYVALYSRQFGTRTRKISPAAMDLLQSYSWPGNARELENAMKSAVVLAADSIEPEHLPAEIRGIPSPDVALFAPPRLDGDDRLLHLRIDLGVDQEEIDLKALGAQAAEQTERYLIQELLRRGPMSSARMAKILGVDPKTLRMKLRKYGLESRLTPEV